MSPKDDRTRKGKPSPALSGEVIKSVARRQMSEQGTAGISLRGIARELGVTAPAIYNYFSRLEDLITALIVDAFTDLAQAMDHAAERVDDGRYGAKILAATLAYREWAIHHSTDFQLIYGNPIPGYVAPAELTGPLARRPFLGIFTYIQTAWENGDLVIPQEYDPVPQQVSIYLTGWKEQTGIRMPDPLVCLVTSGWGRIHGLVMLELFHHSQPLIGDPAAFYLYEIKGYLRYLGMSIES